jgi:hypothetical protein
MLKAVNDQLQFSNQRLDRYGKDQTGNVSYQFNSLGFRSNVEFDYLPDTVFFGGSTTFGIGVAIEQTFPHIVAHKQNLKLWNCSYAHVKYNNQMIFDTISLVHQQVKDIPVVVQWVGDRYDPQCTTSFYQFVEETRKLYPHSIHFLIDGQEEKQKIASGYFELINPIWADVAVTDTHPGPKTHKGIAGFIIKKLS